MIDTDKYEGHTPAPWDWFTTPNDSHIGHLQRHSNLTRVTAEIKSRSAEDDANAALIADAPLLLEEVKRLRGRLRDAEDLLVSCGYCRECFWDRESIEDIADEVRSTSSLAIWPTGFTPLCEPCMLLFKEKVVGLE